MYRYDNLENKVHTFNDPAFRFKGLVCVMIDEDCYGFSSTGSHLIAFKF